MGNLSYIDLGLFFMHDLTRSPLWPNSIWLHLLGANELRWANSQSVGEYVTNMVGSLDLAYWFLCGVSSLWPSDAI